MIHHILQNLLRLRPTTVPLGRWCRTEKILNDVKVDLANMDHCGTCVHEKLKHSKPHISSVKSLVVVKPIKKL